MPWQSFNNILTLMDLNSIFDRYYIYNYEQFKLFLKTLVRYFDLIDAINLIKCSGPIGQEQDLTFYCIIL